MLGRLFGGGGDVEVRIDLDRPEGGYSPGEVVKANITISAPKGAKCREVRAGLVRWHRYQTIDVSTDRDNDRDESFVWRTDEDWLTRESLAKDQGLPSNFEQTYSFEWTIPADAAPGCEGKTVQLRYLAKVTIDRAMAKDVNEELALRVVSIAPGQHVVEGAYGQSSDQNAALMQVTLPGLEFQAGDTVNGRLHVEPRSEFDVREIRIELIRNELVMRGDKQNRSAIVEQKAQLSPATKLRPGEAQEFDFSLQIPSDTCPTHLTPATRLSWTVEAILDRSMRSDTRLAQEISVYSQSQ